MHVLLDHLHSDHVVLAFREYVFDSPVCVVVEIERHADGRVVDLARGEEEPGGRDVLRNGEGEVHIVRISFEDHDLILDGLGLVGGVFRVIFLQLSTRDGATERIEVEGQDIIFESDGLGVTLEEAGETAVAAHRVRGVAHHSESGAVFGRIETAVGSCGHIGPVESLAFGGHGAEEGVSDESQVEARLVEDNGVTAVFEKTGLSVLCDVLDEPLAFGGCQRVDAGRGVVDDLFGFGLSVRIGLGLGREPDEREEDGCHQDEAVNRVFIHVCFVG